MRRALTLTKAIMVAVGLLLAPSAVVSAATQADTGQALGDSMVWLDSAPEGKQVYAVFRKEIRLAQSPKVAILHLFADSRYILWINGQYVERGPCRFDHRWCVAHVRLQ